MPYAEIVASIASRSAGPGTRANIDEFTETTAQAIERGRRRRPRQGDHHPEPGRAADDHARHRVLRDRPATPTADAITASIHAMVAEVQQYVPGYTLRAEPQFDEPARRAGRATARVAVFLEVKGTATTCPPYAGNLDIMTAAAARVGELMAGERWRGRPPRSSTSPRAPTSDTPAVRDVRITDTTLRDGSHAMAHQFTEEQVRDHRARAGRGRASRSSRSPTATASAARRSTTASRAADEIELIAAAVDEATQAKIAVLLLPGIGTSTTCSGAHDAGAPVARIATHCTEADVSVQHFGAARELGMETVGFLMLAHRIAPEELAEQARIMVDAGAQCVYVVDSAGALVLDDGARTRVEALVARDRRRGAGRLPRPPEPVAGRGQLGARRTRTAPGRSTARCARSAPARATRRPRCWPRRSSGWASRTGVDVGGRAGRRRGRGQAVPAALPSMDRAAIVQGYAGVYSRSCCTPSARRERYGVPAHEILAAGRRAGLRRRPGGHDHRRALQLAGLAAAKER